MIHSYLKRIMLYSYLPSFRHERSFNLSATGAPDSERKVFAAAMGKAECALCRSRRRDFCCAQCTSDMLQQRRTMLAALRADVAVLRKKSAFALHVRRFCLFLL